MSSQPRAPRPEPTPAEVAKTVSAPATAQAAAVGPRPVPLTSLRPGEQGRLHASIADGRDRQVLEALGLVLDSTLRLAKAGNPWIVQVRSTRIGLADTVARHLLVIPEPTR